MNAPPEKFAPGDVVVVRSGGPHMTVSSMASPVTAGCVFMYEGALRKVEVPVACLQKVETKPPKRGEKG